MTPDTRYVSTKCFSSDKEEKNQGGTAESFVPTKGGWFLFYVLKDVYEKGEMKMKDKLQQIREKAIAEIEGSDGLERLNEVRQAVLGKKGELTAVLKGMKDVAPEDRPKVGQWVNDTRSAIETVLEEKMKKLEADALKKRYEAEKIDVTMPAVKHEKGNLHPSHRSRYRALPPAQVLQHTTISVSWSCSFRQDVPQPLCSFPGMSGFFVRGLFIKGPAA